MAAKREADGKGRRWHQIFSVLKVFMLEAWGKDR
jgi:hypothetical protein